jgi:hypothetical protein
LEFMRGVDQYQGIGMVAELDAIIYSYGVVVWCFVPILG